MSQLEPEPRPYLIGGIWMRPITQSMSCTHYLDGWAFWREGITARALARYFDWYGRRGRIIGCFDAMACGAKEGDVFHWWMLGWWLAIPSRLVHEFGTYVSAEVWQ